MEVPVEQSNPQRSSFSQFSSLLPAEVEPVHVLSIHEMVPASGMCEFILDLILFLARFMRKKYWRRAGSFQY